MTLKKNLMQIFKVAMVMMGLTAILLLILALMLFKMSLSERAVAVGIVLIYVIVNFAGGFLMGKIKGENKYKWGIVIGLSFFLILTLISTIITGEMYGNGIQAVWALLTCIGGGMVGGMCA